MVQRARAGTAEITAFLLTARYLLKSFPEAQYIFMNHIRGLLKGSAIALAFAMGLILFGGTNVSAQWRDNRQNDDRYERNRNNDRYDRNRNNDRYNRDRRDDRKAFEKGFKAGMKQGLRDGRRNRGWNNGGWNNGGWNNGGWNNSRGGGDAYNRGYQQGYREGISRSRNNGRRGGIFGY